MSKVKNEFIQLPCEEFTALLKEWGKYISIKIHKIPRKSLEDYNNSSWETSEWRKYGKRFNDEIKERISIKEIEKELWQSLKDGAQSVQKIHTELFSETQIQHFKEEYIGYDQYQHYHLLFSAPCLPAKDNFHFYTPEDIVQKIKDYEFEEPIEMFNSFGLKTQKVIIENGWVKESQ